MAPWDTSVVVQNKITAVAVPALEEEGETECRSSMLTEMIAQDFPQ